MKANKSTPEPKDPTAAKRTAALKARLEQDGGGRMTVNLQGSQVRKLAKLIKAGVGADKSAVVRKLIDAAECP